MVNLTFLVRSLDLGGAERQLVLLTKSLDKQKFNVTVLSFYGGGILQKEIEEGGIKVIVLDKRNRWDILPFYIRLLKHTKALHPDILHGVLTVPNIVTVCLKPFIPRTHIVFGIRTAFMDLSQYDWLARIVNIIENFFSIFPDLIIVNSKDGQKICEQRKFPRDKMVVIFNGIDLTTYYPDVEAGKKVRSAWNIMDNEILIGLVGRLDPVKDHHNFLQAASIIRENHPNVRFVCVGSGPDLYKQKLVNLANRQNLANCLIWAGARHDLNAVYNAFDICCNSSNGEGFPNVIGEAMACGIPVVATDVGDSALIIGETGRIVPARNAILLAEALEELISLSRSDRKTLGEKARQRIENNFGLKQMINATENALMDLLQSP